MNAETFPEAMPATSARFLNRELCWLEFNARVLALAEDPARPLLERVKFLAIYAQNLDEFFQIRVSGLEEQVEAGVAAVTPDGMTPPEQLGGDPGAGRRPAGAEPRSVLSTDLTPALEKERIRLVALGPTRRGRPRRSWAAGSPSGSSRSSRRCRWIRRIRSPTSRACR